MGLQKVCECGKLETTGDPIWCAQCRTFTHGAYVKHILANLNRPSTIAKEDADHTDKA